MYGKVFIILLSFIATIEADGKCPDAEGNVSPGVECVFVPGCQFTENGTLTPLATQCSNELGDADCEQLFPCTDDAPACRDTTDEGGATPDLYPYVRAPACTSPNLRNIALQCAQQCALCCEAPEFNCDDDTRSPVDCQLNRNKCRDTDWTNIMSQYCPKTCGLCTNGTCRDLNSGCNTMTPLCRNVDWVDYMTTNCARTCDACSTTPGSTCSDIATNCAPNANLCTNSVYRELMQQQCCATCSRASSSSVSCSDSDSNCANWVRNGFCSNSFYSPAQRRQYCARSCNLC